MRNHFSMGNVIDQPADLQFRRPRSEPFDRFDQTTMWCHNRENRSFMKRYLLPRSLLSSYHHPYPLTPTTHFSPMISAMAAGAAERSLSLSYRLLHIHLPPCVFPRWFMRMDYLTSPCVAAWSRSRSRGLQLAVVLLKKKVAGILHVLLQQRQRRLLRRASARRKRRRYCSVVVGGDALGAGNGGGVSAHHFHCKNFCDITYVAKILPQHHQCCKKDKYKINNFCSMTYVAKVFCNTTSVANIFATGSLQQDFSCKSRGPFGC